LNSYLTLAEGESQGMVKLVRAYADQEKVDIINSGTLMTLSMKDNGFVSPTAAAGALKTLAGAVKKDPMRDENGMTPADRASAGSRERVGVGNKEAIARSAIAYADPQKAGLVAGATPPTPSPPISGEKAGIKTSGALPAPSMKDNGFGGQAAVVGSDNNPSAAVLKDPMRDENGMTPADRWSAGLPVN
jgi:hypothetical protein